jgi:hypothetical protein
MKYLKTYEAQHVNTIARRFKGEYDKINTKLIEIKQYMDEILLHLSDEGYSVKTDICTDITDNHISLLICNRKPFGINDIKDELEHLSNYLKSKGMETPLTNMFKYYIGEVKARTRIDYDTREEYKEYEFFIRLYPKKVRELRAKIDAIRNSN